MRVSYHPSVQRDVNGILKHYDGISERLADEFWDELISRIEVQQSTRSIFTLLRLDSVVRISKNFHIIFCSTLCPTRFGSPLSVITNVTPNTPLGENSESNRSF
jgi:hypothetical protein